MPPDARHRSTERQRSRWAKIVMLAGESLSTWLPFAILIGLAPGTAVWVLTHPEQATYLTTNSIDPAARDEVFVYALGSLALVIITIVGAAVWHRRRYGTPPIEIAAASTRALAFLLLLPSFTMISVPGFGVAHPYATMFFAAFGAIAAAISAAELRGAALLERLPVPKLSPRAVSTGLIAGVGLVAASYAATAIDLQLTHHRNLGTGAYDLGIFTNVVWHSLHGDFLGCSFLLGGTHTSAHFDPILVLISPVMLIYRGAEALIVLQAVWLASAAVPIYLVGARHVGREFGVVLAVAYLLHPALHAINLFDFHSLSLSVPIVVWAVWLLERGAFRAYAAAIVLLLLVREDMGLQAIGVGLYGVVVARAPRAGIVTIVAGIAWVFVAKRYFMVDESLLMGGDRSYSFASLFRGLTSAEHGAQGILESVLANPFFVVKRAIAEERVRFALQVSLPIGMLPFFAGRRWVLLAFPLALFVLTNALTSIAFHYSASALPGSFVLAAAGGASLARRLQESFDWDARRIRAGLSAGVLVSAALMTSALGALVENETFRAGFHRVERNPGPDVVARWRTLKDIQAQVDDGASVCGSGLTVPHFAARMKLYHLPDCHDAEWIVAIDGSLPGHEARGLERLRHDPRYNNVIQRDGLVALRRSGTTR